MSISGNLVGSYSQIGKTFVIQDDDGNEVMAVVTDQEQIFTATDNDVRLGMTYASDAGVSTGTKESPIYHSTEGYKIVTNGSKFILPIPHYDYTKLQALFCSYNTSFANSVATDRVAVNNGVYPVQSSEAESAITLNTDNGYIDFGITNTSGKPYLIRYFTFKEIY